MDIQKNLTLQEKQKFWAEQLPNFESKYWLPSHFEFLAFDMDQGNYTIKDDLDPSFEDDATEIWHRVNTGWAMWKKAINFSKPHEGFVLVPKELSDEVADELASDAFNNAKSLFDSEYRGYSALQREHIRLRWCKRSAKQYQSDYKAMIEAQEQGHE